MLVGSAKGRIGWARAVEGSGGLGRRLTRRVRLAARPGCGEWLVDQIFSSLLYVCGHVCVVHEEATRMVVSTWIYGEGQLGLYGDWLMNKTCG